VIAARLADESVIGIVEVEVPSELVGRWIAGKAAISARLLIG